MRAKRENIKIQETIDRENFTAEEAADLCMDNGTYGIFFDTSYGLDCPLPDDVDKDYTLKRTSNRVRVQISSYRGMCAGAFHTYASIDIPGARLVKMGPNGVQSAIGGFISHKFNQLPYIEQDKLKPIYSIEICRYLSQAEIDSDTLRWRNYEEGDRTNAFETLKDAMMQTCNIMRARLSRDWIIEVETCCLEFVKSQMAGWTVEAYD